METFQEWLVTDPNGSFAMGTSDGSRRRKCHGLFVGAGDPGEAEAFLASIEVEIEGRRIWPLQQGDAQAVFESGPTGPRWRWSLDDGEIRFELRKNSPAGIRLSWNWSGSRNLPFRLRPIFAMSVLEELDGKSWALRELGEGVYRIEADPDHRFSRNQVYCRLSPEITWHEEPLWCRSFLGEKLPSDAPPVSFQLQEHLFSGGVFEGILAGGSSLSLILAEHPEELGPEARSEKQESLTLRLEDYPYPDLEVLLNRSARVATDLPWFGTFGRETLVALPALTFGRISEGESPARVRDWAYRILDKWTDAICMEKRGADGPLWYGHALAALWVVSLERSEAGEELFPDFEDRFSAGLEKVIAWIREGGNPSLRINPEGLLEVTDAQASWLGRKGILSQINALWFQARFLSFLWGGGEGFYELEQFGARVLRLGRGDTEDARVFLDQIPLAPALIDKEWHALRAELRKVRGRFLCLERARAGVERGELERKWTADRASHVADQNVFPKLSEILVRLWTQEADELKGA